MTNKFKVGDTVKMSDVGKKQYQDAKYNPYDLTGVITKIDRIIVKWSNEETNSYDPRHIELVEPKQEQYYTSIPKDVKVGDKFQVISETGYKDKFKWAGSKKFPLGSIVTLDYEIPSDEPRFVNSNGDGTYLNWGCLKPVKENVQKEIEYEAGDWVQLINSKFKDHVDSMDKYIGTIQKIDKKHDSYSFRINGWNFHPDDFVKKVDAPVTQCKLVDVPSQTLIVKTITSTDVQQFSIGDEVELIDRASGYQVYADVGSTGKIISIEGEQIKVAFKRSNQSCKACQIKLIKNKTTNNNGKSNSNNKSIIFPSITSTISTGSTPRGIVIQSSGEKISLGY